MTEPQRNPPPRKRRIWSAEVAETQRIAPEMVRLTLISDEFAEFPELNYTDHYVKLLFPPPGADYGPGETRAHQDDPPESRPITRTYTIRSFDVATGRMAIDFVVHGTEGIAGPWSAAAQPGDQIHFFGPGGAWRPEADARHVLLAGDESALPAIAAALAEIPAGATAYTFVEVNTPADEQPGEAPNATWVHRKSLGTAPGLALAQAVRGAELPDDLVAFVHGNAEMIKDLRRYLFVEREIPRPRVSISGYWRTGQTEDAWQAGKREFIAQMEAEEGVAQPSG